MKLLLKIIIGICVYSSTCTAVECKLLISLEPIDLSEFSFYSSIIEQKDGKDILKKEYRTIEKIDMNRMVYLSDGLKITGMLIKPREKGLYPCIIYNRGGNRDFGKLSITDALNLGQLAIQGYVVIAGNYRGGGGSEGRDEYGGRDINDVLNLIEVLEEIEGADIDRIGMYGWSRGGMMTYMALTKTSRIKAAVVGAAPSDLTKIERSSLESNIYSRLIPNYWDNREEELKKRSAIFWVDKFPKNVPILLVHGNSDWRGKTEHALNLALEFDRHRIPYRLKIYEGADHGITEHRSDLNSEIYNWFYRFLKNGDKLPDMEYHGD